MNYYSLTEIRKSFSEMSFLVENLNKYKSLKKNKINTN